MTAGEVAVDLAPELAELREATGEVVEATRRLMRHVSTSRADPDQLRAAAAALDAVTAGLGEAGPRVLRVPFDEEAVRQVRAGRAWTMFRFNPMMVPLRLVVDGARGRAELTPDSVHEGPPDLLHGGFAAHILDAFLGSLVQAQGRPCYTAGLELAFRAPTLLDVPIVVEGEVAEPQGRKVRATAWISQRGQRTVEATGLFIQPVTGSADIF